MSNVPELPEPQRAPIERYSVIDPRVSLIPVQQNGSRRPFFYMHVHWIGGAFYSFILARELGADQPLYVMDPYKLDGLPTPPTIEAVAAAYITSIRAVQPEGPYLLGGFCAGGLLAYEVARQFQAAGQGVDLLVLIDPMAGSIRFIRLLGRFIRRSGGLMRLQPARQLDWFLRLRYLSRIARRSRDENSEHVDELIRRWQARHPQRRSLMPAAEALRQDWMAVFVWAVSGYSPGQYQGKMTYLFARENPDSRRLWWGNAAETENAEIFFIPGTHETCRTEYLHDLAQQLGACLKQVQA